ncbi:MAG: cytochrome c oxidase subunit II [Acidobacteriota bacterium]|nr:cytochrome c oxidase subunit II [Acidobacteriota bacterium]
MDIFENLPLFPEAASTVAGKVDALYFFGIFLSAFFSLGIAIVLVAFAIKYRRRSEDAFGVPEKTSTPLEITWSVIPLIISLFLFAWGVHVFLQLNRVPPDAVEYTAVGKQWMWKFKHPEGNREINDLHIPVNTKIVMKMTSEDVIHSFFVPAFRVKQDVLPGRYTTVWFEATKPGVYHLFCTEFCGAEHAQMIGKVYVMEQGDYEAWLGGREPGETVASGEELFQNLACITCHRGDSGSRGPLLAGLDGGEVQLADGRTLQRDDEYLRESILNPRAKIVQGYDALMPSYQGQITEEQLMALIRYVKELNQTSDEADAVTTAAVADDAGAAEEG